MRNGGWIIGLSILVIVIILGGIIYLNHVSKPKPLVVGGDKDKGGCLIGAGYSWCESKQKCLRVWEESCAESFCGREDAAAVYNCGDYVKVDDQLMGGEVVYYNESMGKIVCPTGFAPEDTSQECKDLKKLNCTQVSC